MENKCEEYIEAYFKYLEGKEVDSRDLEIIKKHILNCDNCLARLHKYVDAIDVRLLESDLKSSLSCKEIEKLAYDVYTDLKDEAREEIINHLLICRRCRDKFIDLFIERLDKDNSILNYDIKIPEIKSPIILLELKREKEKQVKQVIRQAESSIVKIKPDGGIKYRLRDLVEKRIEALPPYPTNVRKIIELIDIDADLRDIARELKKDVSLSARILQIANSPYYRAQMPIEDIQRALSRIGLTSVSRIVTIFGIYSVVVKQCGNYLYGYDIPMKVFLNYSTMIAVISMLLAPKFEFQSPEPHDFSFEIDTVAYTAGLVENLGMLVLNHCIDKNLRAEIKRLLNKGVDIVQVEDSLFGITHAEVGGRLLKKWELSDSFIHSIVSHHLPLASIMNEKNLLSKIIYPADTIASELLRPISKVRPYLNILPSEEALIDLLPFKSREELNEFYENELLPTFEDNYINYDKSLFSN